MGLSCTLFVIYPCRFKTTQRQYDQNVLFYYRPTAEWHAQLPVHDKVLIAKSVFESSASGLPVAPPRKKRGSNVYSPPPLSPPVSSSPATVRSPASSQDATSQDATSQDATSSLAQKEEKVIANQKVVHIQCLLTMVVVIKILWYAECRSL